MELINACIFFALFGVSSSFLMQDIISNKTSSVSSSGNSSAETTDQSIHDLMTILIEEKIQRFQLEQRLDETEKKLQLFDQFHDAVTAELQNERNTNSRLEQMYNELKEELRNASTENVNLLKEVQSMKLAQKYEDSVLKNITNFMTQYGRSSNRSLARNDQMVAFSVDHPVSLTHLRFNATKFEMGGAYNISTGKLVCNLPGIYFFTFTIIQSRSGTFQICCLYINDQAEDQPCAISGGGNGDFPSGSRSVIVRLHMNDEVSLQCSGSKLFESDSCFSGFLIQAEN